jgi:hypothetical protein
MRLLFALLLLPSVAFASFDWGGDCSSGDGSFAQFVPDEAIAVVGEIPTGKADVRIELTADDDVDVQLVDVLTGTEIIAWPGGLLNGYGEACVTWEDVEYCWSGYNGGGTADTLGHEWIEVHGVTNRALTMRAYGYQPADATVDYSFETTPTCGEVGEGSFFEPLAQGAITLVGEIPAGKVNVEIELQTEFGADLDVQLVDATNGDELVAWPDGLLSGAGEQTLQHHGMTIHWSGYNGIDGDWGHESIEIEGATTRPLTVRAFGYQAGTAQVDYEWGDGVGATCGGIAGQTCDDGLWCKGAAAYPDATGECHTELWCAAQISAASDCANVMHIMTPGFFRCADYRCQWTSCGQNDPAIDWASQITAVCATMRFACEDGKVPFSNQCGCGCIPE